eukprot:jgi/Psemu1/306103/fgenesh1_kg.235_\
MHARQQLESVFVRYSRLKNVLVMCVFIHARFVSHRMKAFETKYTSMNIVPKFRLNRRRPNCHGSSCETSISRGSQDLSCLPFNPPSLVISSYRSPYQAMDVLCQTGRIGYISEDYQPERTDLCTKNQTTDEAPEHNKILKNTVGIAFVALVFTTR